MSSTKTKKDFFCWTVLLICIVATVYCTYAYAQGDGVLAATAECHPEPALCNGWYNNCITINGVLAPNAYCLICQANGDPIKWCRTNPKFDCLSNVNPSQYPQAAVKCASKYNGNCCWDPVNYEWYCTAVPNSGPVGDCKLVPCTGSRPAGGGGNGGGS